jgi:serine/threonine protein kinase
MTSIALIINLQRTGHLGMKSVVYSFGVVLLEMLTGLRAYDSKRPDGQESLVNWRKPWLSSKRMVKAMMDTRMDGQYSSVAALQAAQLTLKCLESDHKIRPSMEQVVEVLEEIAVLV